MAKKGIEEMISEIEIFIDNCKYQPLSSSKIIVPKDDMENMLHELRMKLPDEIERGKKIMRNREALLAEARTRADSIIAESVAEANRKVDQSQIIELANIRANEILELARSQAEQIVYEAETEANEIRLGSMYYTREKLAEVSDYIASTLEAERSNYENLIHSLENNLEIVTENMDEIAGNIAAMNGDTSMMSQQEEDDDVMEPEEDYNVYGKTEYSSKDDDEDDEDEDDDDFDDDFLDE